MQRDLARLKSKTYLVSDIRYDVCFIMLYFILLRAFCWSKCGIVLISQPQEKTQKYNLEFCLTVHHQLGKVIQKNQLDATIIC